MKHLNEAAAEALSLDTEMRLRRIRSPRWIGYPAAKAILAKLTDLLAYPTSHRMPNLLIVGDTNNGKTTLVQRFCAKHPPSNPPNGSGLNAPVICIQAPPIPDEGRLYNTVLELFMAPYRPSDRVDKKQFQVLRLLRYANLKVLVIDEIHHILAGNLNRQRAFLNVLKFLGNELQIPIVAVGTRAALHAIQTDEQLSNRFEPILLPRWQCNADFLRLLASFERMLPLRAPSQLHEPSLANRLFALTEGYLGELDKLLIQAATRAVRTDHERIDHGLLDQLDWVPPSDRKRRLDQIA